MNSSERSTMGPGVTAIRESEEHISRLAAVRKKPTGCRLTRWTEEVTSLVYVVDSDVAASNWLKKVIRAAGWQECTCASAEEFLGRARAKGPCCLLADLTLPGLSGLDLQSLVADLMEMPVIFISAQQDVAQIVKAMKAGAIDFLIKPCNETALVRGIERALARSELTLRVQAEQQVLRNRYVSLTGREREVMALVVAGRSNKEVGYELGIAEITAKVHRASVMRKMRTHSLADLVKFAARLAGAPAPLA